MSDQSDFIVSLYEAARKASAQTGMSWELILAQAAQETGWGAKTIPGTYNIFNIKADRSWSDQTKLWNAPEFINGKWVNVTDPYRVYDSYDSALIDRANFLLNNPRYHDIFSSGVLGDFRAEALVLQNV